MCCGSKEVGVNPRDRSKRTGKAVVGAHTHTVCFNGDFSRWTWFSWLPP